MVEIIEVNNRKLMKAFVGFPLELYKDCKQYVPSFYGDEINLLNSKKNPSGKYCESKFFIAKKNNKIVGRVAGIINHRYNESTGKKFVRFGRIDMVNDICVARALIEAVESFGAVNGMEYIHGPWGYNDIDREGMLTYGFEHLSTFATMYSYEYYVELIEKLGFEKEVGWKEFFVPTPKSIDTKFEKITDYVFKRYSLKMVDGLSTKQTIKQYGSKFFDLINREAYNYLYGAVPMTEEEKQQILSMFGLVIKSDYMCIIVDKNDNVVGGAVVLPSFAKQVKEINGKLFPFGFLKILKAARHPKMFEFALVAVDGEYRHKGLVAAMMAKITKVAIKNGIVGAESNPELEDNANIQAFWNHFENVEHKRSRNTFIKKIQ